MSALFVYMTAADADEAEALGRMLVSRRLVACVNVLGPIRSLFWWDGAVRDEAEVALVAKTWDDRLDELTAASAPRSTAATMTSTSSAKPRLRRRRPATSPRRSAGPSGPRRPVRFPQPTAWMSSNT